MAVAIDGRSSCRATRFREFVIADDGISIWTTLRNGWALLGPAERSGAFIGLALFCAAGIMSSLMVGSIFPFLAVLSDPSTITDMPIVTRIGDVLGLTTTYDYLVALGLTCGLIIVVSSLLLIARTFFIERFCSFMVYRLSRRLLRHYLSQPYPFFIDHHSGDLATNILSEAGNASSSFLKPAATLVASSITTIAVLAMLVAINPIVAGAGLAVIATFYGLVLVLCRRLAARLGQTRLDANQRQFRTATEVIGGIKDVKLTGREDAYVSRFDGPAHAIAEVSSRIAVLSDAPRYVMQTMAFLGIIAICLIVISPDTIGTPDGIGGILPALGVLALAAQRLSPEIHSIYASVTRLRFGAAVLERLSTTFDTPGEDLPDPGGQTEPIHLRDAISLRSISYAYPSAEFSGISDVSLTIRAGERIGIVGSTGAGKTTLADVILGLLPPQAGTMTVDGQTVDRSNIRRWQKTISYVPQEIFLTDDSIASNIALGIEPEHVDRDRVEQCARIARIHDFIVGELPKGYETPTGERGVRLSGGQRQRIGLARALYREADLIVLDEATSALDTVTERAVLDGIQSLHGQQTLIMIAHRLSTLRACTRLLVMERGRIVAAGPWDVLLATSPAFRELVEHAGTGTTQVAE